MKVLITGAGGQLGQALKHTQPENITVVGLTRAELDITNSLALADAVAQHQPTHIINCAAYTNVDMANANPDLAHRVNAQGPAILATAAFVHGVRLLHVSTDYVFAGDATKLYAPDAPAFPCNVYGHAKLAGEIAIKNILPEALILRTSWVYSQWGTNFVKRLLDNLNTWDEIGVVSDQFSCPTHAESVARVLWLATQRPDFRGIHHWTDAGVVSRYEWALAIMEEAKLHGLVPDGVSIKPMQAVPQEGGVVRPAYSALDCTSTQLALGIEQVPWRENLRKLFIEGLT